MTWWGGQRGDLARAAGGESVMPRPVPLWRRQDAVNRQIGICRERCAPLGVKALVRKTDRGLTG
jgi:hypothetical protein